MGERSAPVWVAAALMIRDDKFLICRRPAHKIRGGLWEFPGGKVEPGESAAQALARECGEELGVSVCPGEVYMELTHPYPDITVKLTLLQVFAFQGQPQLLEHEALAWIGVEEIDDFDFCPADKLILERLKRQGLPRPSAEIAENSAKTS